MFPSGTAMSIWLFSDPLDYFDASLSDVILNDETPDFDTVESIQFQGEDSYQVTYVVHKDSSGMGYLEGTLTQTGAIGTSAPASRRWPIPAMCLIPGAVPWAASTM